MKIPSIQTRVLPNIVKSATKTLPQEVKLATVTGMAALTSAIATKTDISPYDPPEQCGSLEAYCTTGLSF